MGQFHRQQSLILPLERRARPRAAPGRRHKARRPLHPLRRQPHHRSLRHPRPQGAFDALQRRAGLVEVRGVENSSGRKMREGQFIRAAQYLQSVFATWKILALVRKTGIMTVCIMRKIKEYQNDW